eukprot:TRINITY_DN29681_c1_g3_i1.p1 TRINITY_DN29681_c1_g3~~TRINITY_DN29681_c1_g3_i1.p1  ORF type:complete len:109 (-),score=5.10 TRINITY_DN29681_c1_g3_i1:24-350(-)
MCDAPPLVSRCPPYEDRSLLLLVLHCLWHLQSLQRAKYEASRELAWVPPPPVAKPHPGSRITSGWAVLGGIFRVQQRSIRCTAKLAPPYKQLPERTVRVCTYAFKPSV